MRLQFEDPTSPTSDFLISKISVLGTELKPLATGSDWNPGVQHLLWWTPKIKKILKISVDSHNMSQLVSIALCTRALLTPNTPLDSARCRSSFWTTSEFTRTSRIRIPVLSVKNVRRHVPVILAECQFLAVWMMKLEAGLNLKQCSPWRDPWNAANHVIGNPSASRLPFLNMFGKNDMSKAWRAYEGLYPTAMARAIGLKTISFFLQHLRVPVKNLNPARPGTARHSHRSGRSLPEFHHHRMQRLHLGISLRSYPITMAMASMAAMIYDMIMIHTGDQSVIRLASPAPQVPRTIIWVTRTHIWKHRIGVLT